MTISNTPIASTDFSRFFHDYIKHTHRLDWLQQVFQCLYQTPPSSWLTSEGFAMTISNTPIASTDFNRFFHDYIKHTHRLDWLQQVFPWLCQAHTSSTDFCRFFHHYIKHTLRFDWLQQVFSWLYQTHPSPRLTSPGFSMTISNTPFASTDFTRFFHDYVKHTHRLDWLQQDFPWLSNIPIVSTDFSKLFHDYVNHTPLQLTSAGFSMTISNTLTASTDFSNLFHDYIQHIHRIDWLQQVFPWLYQTLSLLRLTSSGFFMTISNTLTASTDFSRFFYDYIYHTHRLHWLQQVFPSLYQTHSPLRLTSAGFFMTISNTPIASTDFSNLFHDYIKHTHRLDWLQQVFPWLYQTHSPLRLTSAGFSMTISNTPIASTDFNRFFHDYVKHIHRFDWLQQVFPWLYQTHPSIRLTSAGCSMTIWNTPIASTDFSRLFHDYIKHTHRLDWLQQFVPWLYETHSSSWLTSAGFSMTISNTLTAWTDFSRFFYDYI
jgi:hypothetical protein